ncbi:sensor histidine kinase [Acinetobacter tianfuensis]|uniref:ATP-binding protein n=1 Tax=Acinetobacter tianfuensis TaxID=2419603 RepID=A0A3A8EGM6_9GAMM|nr:ATP-binding protein [Acinetobacter tianfuensis]RKG34087.1 ATP-binding protein [Acinetobacter tianfuensis]
MRIWKYLCLLLCFMWNIACAEEIFPINSTCQATIHTVEKVKTKSLENIPSSGWKRIGPLPDIWEKQPDWKNYNGGAWYRLTWGWGCRQGTHLNEPIALSLGYINSAGAIYLNGDLLWKDRNLIEPLSTGWNIVRHWILPKTGLKPDENVIMVYVVGYGNLKAGLGQIAFNNVENNAAFVTKKRWENRTLFQINLILSGTLGIICLIIWLFRREEPSFGWFALSSLMWMGFISNVLRIETAPFPNLIVASKVNMIFFILYFLAFCLYLLRFIGEKKPKTEKAVLFISFILLLANIFATLKNIQPVFNIIVFFYTLLFTVTYIYLCIKAYKSKRIDFIFLALCMSAIVFFGLFDIFSYTIWGGSELPPLTPYTSPIVTVFIVVILGARLNRNIRKVEKFNEHLAQKVHQVSEDLSASLHDKHQLELSNARLHERMKLSHDLHDGLGASIVRSMIMVDQCAHPIPNQQFLSMLKLLRDDLRQIIDSGSAENNRVPESPVLWVAPVRYRFNSLLDEMDIRGQWQLPAQWIFVPNALQCLTLIRILEESLINVVKHSQADKVLIRMQFLSDTQLELTVEDNGIGFDVQCVYQNGMSIGMRSMKMRAERMGGEFNIQSEAGRTCMKVVFSAENSTINSGEI